MAMECKKTVPHNRTRNKVYEPGKDKTLTPITVRDLPVGTLFTYRNGNNYYIKVGRDSSGFSDVGIVGLKTGILYDSNVSGGQIEVVERLAIEKEAS